MKDSIIKNFFEKKFGKKSVLILEILFKKDLVNENILSKKTKIPINEIRSILYELSSKGLVGFIRKKDKRKGWFIYFWFLKEEETLNKIKEEVIKEIDDYRNKLIQRQKERFYYCNTCKHEVGEEKALAEEFVCPECATPYDIVDNKKFIEEINRNILKREKELLEVQKEINIDKEKSLREKLKKDKTKKIKKKINKKKKSKK